MKTYLGAAVASINEAGIVQTVVTGVDIRDCIYQVWVYNLMARGKENPGHDTFAYKLQGNGTNVITDAKIEFKQRGYILSAAIVDADVYRHWWKKQNTVYRMQSLISLI